MGWIGNVLCLLGIWQIGRKKRVGFLLTVASCAFWTAQGICIGSHELIFIEITLGALSFYNWRKWSD